MLFFEQRVVAPHDSIDAHYGRVAFPEKAKWFKIIDTDYNEKK
jgi:hypothetical protein